MCWLGSVMVVGDPLATCLVRVPHACCGAQHLLEPLSLSHDHRVIDGADTARFAVPYGWQSCSLA